MDFIERLQPTPEGSPPWVGLGFKDPLESDELSAKLLSAYPKGQTLRERKHLAIIHFFLQELGVMRSSNRNKQYAFDDPLDESRILSDLLGQGNRAPSVPSSCASPSTSGSVPSPGLVDLAKASIKTYQYPRPTQPSSPDGNPQLLVWNMRDGRSLRQKTKRKMTQEEREAYKETRKRGACDKCKKNKGRCTHKDGELSFAAVESHKPPKRKTSTEFAIDQPDKAVKTEPGSDIRHFMPKQRPFLSPTSTQIAISAPPRASSTQSAGSAGGPPVGSGRLEIDPGADARLDEYVPHESVMEPYSVSRSLDSGQWSPGFPPTAMDPSIPEYTQGPGMHNESFSPQMYIPTSSNFPFTPEFPPYNPSWNINQDPSMRTSGPP